MKTAAVLFTYTRDRDLVLVAAQKLLAQGVAVTLCTDFNDPFDRTGFPEEIRWRSTAWPRNGNLNGKPCVVGILRELDLAARAAGADWACKCDSDTLVNPALFARLADAADGVGFDSTVRNWYGGFYAIRAAKLPALIALALALPETVGTPPVVPAYPEDMTIGDLMKAAGCNYETRQMGWHHNATDTPAPPTFWAVSFGWMDGMPAPFLTGDQRRTEVARRMAAYTFTPEPAA